MSRGKSKHFLSYDIHQVRRKRVRGFFRFILFLFIVFLALTHFIVTPYSIRSASMIPMIQERERVVCLPLVYGVFVPFTDIRILSFGEPKRGDIVIAQPGYYSPPPWYIRALDPVVRFFTLQQVRISAEAEETHESSLILKRLIALPGDTVLMRNNVAYIKPRGEADFIREFELLKKEYTIELPEEAAGPLEEQSLGSYPEQTLGDNEYFLLGDNRSASQDSRYWGPVGFERIRGKIVLSYWPKLRIR